VVSAALVSAKDRCLPLQKVQLINSSLSCNFGRQNQKPHSLTISLAKLVESVPSLQLLQSRSALSLLSHTHLVISQLNLCDTVLERDSVEQFLRSNVKALLSISIHDAEVLEQNWLVRTKLTPALIRDMVGVKMVIEVATTASQNLPQ
jgi:hypothetical protein